MIIIRRAELSETWFLEEMLYESLYIAKGEPALPRSIIFEPEIYKYIKNWGRPYDCALVALNNDKLIGVIWGRLFYAPEIGYGTINDETPEIGMAVKSEFRSQGIGTRLIEAISQEYLKMNIEAISLSVDKRNKAINLYLRTGFEIIAENGTAWTMRKVLSNTL